MLKPFSGIFHFLRPGRTQQHFQPRKPMAIPVASIAHNRQLCNKLFTELDAAEAEVLNEINDPEKAWPLLSQIRQLRRVTQTDYATLSPADRMAIKPEPKTTASPVKTVTTKTGATLSVFNGEQAR